MFNWFKKKDPNILKIPLGYYYEPLTKEILPNSIKVEYIKNVEYTLNGRKLGIVQLELLMQYIKNSEMEPSEIDELITRLKLEQSKLEALFYNDLLEKITTQKDNK